MSIIMGIGTVLGVLLSVGLFIFIPTAATKGLGYLVGGDLNWALRSAVEGVLKIAIFIAYLALVSLMPDIRRTFEYHGAEHKSVACYEKGLELTPENAEKCTRFHPRCGTSFIFLMLILSIVIGMFIRIDILWLRSLVKLMLLPLSVGLGFEFIMYAGRHDNALIRVISAPGLWMQRVTTKEPDRSQLEVAIKALKGALPAEFANDEEAEEDTGDAADGDSNEVTVPSDASAQTAETGDAVQEGTANGDETGTDGPDEDK